MTRNKRLKKVVEKTIDENLMEKSTEQKPIAKKIETIWRTASFNKLIRTNIEDQVAGPSNRCDSILSPTNKDQQKAFLAIQNHMVILGVSFQRDLLELQQMYQEKFYKPLQKLQGTLLEALNNPEQKPSLDKIDDRIRDTTLYADNSIYNKLKSHCELLVSAGSNDTNDDFYKNFWKKVLCLSNPIVSNLMKAKDLDIFDYLVGITSNTFSERNSSNKTKTKETGFEIVFKFSPNPYFHNRKILKKYLVNIFPNEEVESSNDENKDLQHLLFDKNVCLEHKGPRLASVSSTKIVWKAKYKKIRNKMNEKTVKSINCFFDYLEFKWNDSNIREKNQIKLDYTIGIYISDVMIPNAFAIVRKGSICDDVENQQENAVDEFGLKPRNVLFDLEKKINKTGKKLTDAKKDESKSLDADFYKEYFQLWNNMNKFRKTNVFKDIMKRLGSSCTEVNEMDSNLIQKDQCCLDDVNEKCKTEIITSKCDIRKYLKILNDKTGSFPSIETYQSKDINHKTKDVSSTSASNKLIADERIIKLLQTSVETDNKPSTDDDNEVAKLDAQKLVNSCSSESKEEIQSPTPYQSAITSSVDLNATPLQSNRLDTDDLSKSIKNQASKIVKDILGSIPVAFYNDNNDVRDKVVGIEKLSSGLVPSVSGIKKSIKRKSSLKSLCDEASGSSIKRQKLVDVDDSKLPDEDEEL